MSAIALNKLLDYILSLSLSNKNKQWLADKILESQTSSNAADREREEKLLSLFGVWKDDPDADTIEKAINESRMSGVTRHIVSFDEV